MSRFIVCNICNKRFFDRSLISHIFFNILHTNAFINDLQKFYFIYLLYFIVKIGITGTIIFNSIKFKIF
jgi:hypothetical protein